MGGQGGIDSTTRAVYPAPNGDDGDEYARATHAPANRGMVRGGRAAPI